MSQSRTGYARPGRYRGSAAAQEAGATFAGDHTVEAAIVKSMWLLGQGAKGDEFRRRFNIPIAGECTQRNADSGGD
ncbi:MAG: hypothetical protein GXP62_15690 [Oligoflexia bacterium]|nr:hypothetical protein [Oligoflexia bacterium]